MVERVLGQDIDHGRTDVSAWLAKAQAESLKVPKPPGRHPEWQVRTYW
jgi:hypothetical protein